MLRRVISRTARLAPAALAGLLLMGGPVNAASTSQTYEVYALRGYEVWFTDTVGTFMGAGTGSGMMGAGMGGTGDLSGWYTSVEHSVAITPTGTVNGGRAVLQRLDGVRMDGTFSGGYVWQTNDGAGCTNESHQVVGTVSGLTRSDRPSEVGVAFFNATLVHYRTMIFNRCIAYSASVNGTFSILI
jgi:hypothetical protein